MEQLVQMEPGVMLAGVPIGQSQSTGVFLRMKWQGQVYVDAALPFGLRSAPKIFNALADALE